MRYWLDFDSLARCRSRCVVGSILARYRSCRVGPRLGSCNLATPKTGFLQIFTSKKWMLAEASGLNLLNFQN